MITIDFDKIFQKSNEDFISPKNLFASLKNKSKSKEYLRYSQGDVLDQWFNQRNSKDIIIKMNTGAGKTMIGLLILKSSMNENEGNGIYVVPNKYLVEQVKNEAKDLGIEVTDDEEDIRFIRKEAILVITIQKLINGKSIFGLRERDNIKIDNVIIDDAHACLESAEEQSTIRIYREQEIYNKVFNIIERSMQEQNYSKYYDIVNNLNFNSMLIPYKTIIENKENILKILAETDDNAVLFPFQFVKDNIDICDFVISHKTIEISIKCLPIQKISSFENARRRIFLSATLNNDNELIKNFNLIEDIKIICPKDNSDIGNRMILFPQALNPQITDKEIKDAIEEYSKTYKTVIIVPSYKRAEFWSDIAEKIYTKENINSIKNDSIKLAVIVNRYDGIDLPDDLCRVLIIDGLPDTRTLFDAIEESILFDSSDSIKNKIRLIEQGIGRGVRSADDYCAIMLMGHKLINIIHNKEALYYFSEPTLQQIKLSDEVSKQLKNKSLSEILSVYDYCLHKNENWINASIKVLTELKNENNLNINSNIVLLRKAYNYMFMGDYKLAINELDLLINNETDSYLKGYYTFVQSKFYYFIDKIQSDKILNASKKLNPSIPIYSTIIKADRRIKKTENQANEVIKYCIENKLDIPEKYLISAQSILDSLIFAEGTSEEFEQAVCDLGQHLGFYSTRPDKLYGKGPDNLWIFDNTIFVIECKNESTSDKINKEYWGQFLNHLNWTKEEYGNDYRICK